MADYREKIKKYFDKEIGVIQHLDIEAINKVMNVIAEARQREATIYTMGNGGSAATASHFVCDFNKGTSKEKRLIKSYWSRYDVRYKSYFEDTKLFIMYGMSVSKTDGWWLDQIFECISKNGAELIIYKYGCENEESIKKQFVQACIRHKNIIEADVEEVKRHIYVVTFEKNDTYFLGLEEKECKLI